jgi:hypothetical protein
LPANVTTSSAISDSAVLQFVSFGVVYGFNEIYINPPTSNCTGDVPDANQAKSLGYLNTHGDSTGTNLITFNSALLKAGTNRIMVCIRDSLGGIGASNLDDIDISHIVLHYKTLN